ncbi:hypothetical protein SLA2020_357100 [Shorea laevis]
MDYRPKDIKDMAWQFAGRPFQVKVDFGSVMDVLKKYLLSKANSALLSIVSFARVPYLILACGIDIVNSMCFINLLGFEVI